MADTVRTLAALQTLLADNTDQDISPQDIRDMLVSVFPPQVIGAKAFRDAAQNVTTSTTTAISFDTEVFDTDDMWEGVTNPSRITVNTAGLYLVAGCAAHSNADNSPDDRWAYLRKNGTDYIGYALRSHSVGGGNGMTIATFDSAVADDYYEMLVYQNSGSSLDYSQGEGSSLSVIRLGQAAV